MQQFLALWQSLSMPRKISVVVATLAMFSAVLMISRVASSTSMSLLYAGLEPGSAGEVVAALEQRSAPYEVRGSAIYVDSQLRDELRLSLAADGLPENGAQGYELLDSLTGIGTTSQMFDAAYWRAKEGELARTILASSSYKSARVHLSNMVKQPFSRDGDRTASVTVKAQSTVTPDQARALRFLVASAVSGLMPENVSVIDGRIGKVIGAENEDHGFQNPDERAKDIKNRVLRIIAARVGPENVAVEVSVEADMDSESIVSREFDPESRVAISTEIEERTAKSNDFRGSAVTVASNLPDGDAGAKDDNRSSEDRESKERTNYEVSETKREVLKAPGAIKKITVAVLVDAVHTVDEAGNESTAPRSQEELDALRDLVASAVGYDETRGDVITIKSMVFEKTAELGTEADVGILTTMGINLTQIVQLVLLGLVAMTAILFVIRPFFLGKHNVGQAGETLELPNELTREQRQNAPISGEIDDGSLPIHQMNTIAEFDSGNEFEPLPELNVASGFVGQTESSDPVARLRKMIEERQEETVATLKNWMEEGETT
ncbi:flagellar basal-body MS-ring/collar protein FliF [Halocynthiibacter sp. C4]|uniref:flagellar basal-body MS-ring/collar protein FliF n=1 Tax=Halocynthiibacter sp. C4 TaxID=2992758 RepID=UPI00237BD1D1|nr:flagellar basal-body MS-ring/collar protein FliF [Halocynthiibacter sp. C4]MDE0591340.1 flagellar basal-body MS-ring/collar protein FliF [Halocynthiibacter sp. C4]